jgi:hypothetical protein
MALALALAMVNDPNGGALPLRSRPRKSGSNRSGQPSNRVALGADETTPRTVERQRGAMKGIP